MHRAVILKQRGEFAEGTSLLDAGEAIIIQTPTAFTSAVPTRTPIR